MDLEEYRASSLRQWERSADGWGRRSRELQRSSHVVSEWMIEAAVPQPGEVVLELAAGPGETGFMAAERIRPAGRLISSDFAEPMLEAARTRAAERGFNDVEFRVLNGESLKLETASVDVVLCRWGYMLMADPAAALQETRRVLRPGGRVALAVWDGPQANPWVAAVGAAVRRELDAPAPDPDAPGMFALAAPGRLGQRLDEAGFTDVRVEPLDFAQRYDSWEHWWELQLDLGRPLADLVAQCSSEQVERMRADVREAARAFEAPDGGLAIPARTLVAAATA